MMGSRLRIESAAGDFSHAAGFPKRARRELHTRRATPPQSPLLHGLGPEPLTPNPKPKPPQDPQTPLPTPPPNRNRSLSDSCVRGRFFPYVFVPLCPDPFFPEAMNGLCMQPGFGTGLRDSCHVQPDLSGMSLWFSLHRRGNWQHAGYTRSRRTTLEDALSRTSK